MNEIFEWSASQSDHCTESGAADRDVPELQKSHDGFSGGCAVSGVDHCILCLLYRNSDSVVCEVEK